MNDQTDGGRMTGAVDWIGRAPGLAGATGLARRPGDEKVFADALLAAMRAAGLLSVLVPPAFGGPGLSLAETARITERIARQSGSAGLIYAMHMSQALCVVRHGRGAFFEDLQPRKVRDQILIASGTSEKGPGGDIFTSIATVEPADGDRLAGTKESPNISYLDQAGVILLTANLARPKGPQAQVLIALDMRDVQVSVPYPVAFMGMRGILNQPAQLAFSAPRAAVFPDLFATVARRTMTPSIHVLWAALWSGIAWAVLDRARGFVRSQIAPGTQAATLAQHDLSLLINRHHAMNAMIRDAIATCEADTAGAGIGFATAAQINRLKVCCSDWLNEICAGALRLIGIRGYATGGPWSLAEALADALSAPIMVSNSRLVMNTAAIEAFAEESL